jgi:leucyl-tRNA synthetase
MPQWAGSCWYYLRYIDPKNDQQLADPGKLKYWLPVDHYIGGAEHAVLHLLYSRFWHKFLNDIGVVPGKEPFQKLTNQGLILAEDGQKMSKSLGNVINPDDVIQEYGADTMRMYEMFMGPLEMAKPWDTKGIIGVRRFLDKIWKIAESRQLSDRPVDEQIIKQLHKTIKKVGEDIENLRFNTGISAMMILVNNFQKIEDLNKDVYLEFLKLLAPYAPHLAEELWEMAGEKYSIHQQAWPEYDPQMITDDMVTIVFSVNGKVRGKEELPVDISREELEEKALNNENIVRHIAGKQVDRVIVVPSKMVNIVVK